MMIAVLGPDGSGKSSLIDALTAVPGRPVLRIHLRPSVFARNRGVVRGSVDDPHGRPPRGSIASAVKLLFFLADYVAGYWLVVRPARSAGRLVIFDRYFHDLLVDPRRYRYSAPLWLARAMGRLVPKPDLWVILDAPADVLQARSQDVSAGETARQRDGYRALAHTLPHAVVVDATLPLDRVAAHVERAIARHDAQEISVCHGYERR